MCDHDGLDESCPGATCQCPCSNCQHSHTDDEIQALGELFTWAWEHEPGMLIAYAAMAEPWILEAMRRCRAEAK